MNIFITWSMLIFSSYKLCKIKEYTIYWENIINILFSVIFLKYYGKWGRNAIRNSYLFTVIIKALHPNHWINNCKKFKNPKYNKLILWNYTYISKGLFPVTVS